MTRSPPHASGSSTASPCSVTVMSSPSAVALVISFTGTTGSTTTGPGGHSRLSRQLWVTSARPVKLSTSSRAAAISAVTSASSSSVSMRHQVLASASVTGSSPGPAMRVDVIAMSLMKKRRPGAAEGGAAAPEPRRPRLRGAEFQELDRLEVLHAAADALGRVEQHVGLGGVRVAQHAHALPVDDQIAALEVTEGDAQRIGTDIGHVLGLDQREAEQRGASVGGRRRLPQIVAAVVLELAKHRLRAAV